MGGVIGVALAATLVGAAGQAGFATAMRVANPLLAAVTLAGLALAARAVRQPGRV